MAGEPTHHVIHRTRLTDAFIDIPPSLREKLESNDDTVREGAESSVAIRFRHASGNRHTGMSTRYVDFSDLDIKEIERDSGDGEPPVLMDGHGDPIGYYYDPEWGLEEGEEE